MTEKVICLPLLKTTNLLQGTTTVALGDFNFFHGDRTSALDSIQRLKEYAATEQVPLVLAQQVHGDNITIVTQVPDKPVHFFSETDALMTNISGIMLGILTADCVPVFLYDSEEKVIAVIHAGWRGVAKKIVPKCIRLMKEHYHSSSDDIIAGIGPYIAQNNYEIDQDTAFQLGISTDKKVHVDLGVLLREQLLQENLSQGNIVVSDFRTHASPHFFSYRKQGKQAGRMLSFLLLR